MAKKEKLENKAKTTLTKEKKRSLRVRMKNEKAELIFHKEVDKEYPIQVGTKKEVVLSKIDEKGKLVKKFFLKYKNLIKSKKTNLKLYFREFPAKIVKEVTRIRWTSGNNLGRKFLITILFIFVFTVFYLVLDLILHHLLTIVSII